MNKDLIKKLADTLKVTDLEAFGKALSEENGTFEIPKLKIYTDDEHSKLKIYTPESFDTYTTNTEKVGYDKGKVVGEEMQMKAVRDEMGVEVDGYKDKSILVSTYKDHILKEAKIEPDKKVEKLEIDLKTLRETKTELEQGYEKKETDYKSQIKGMKSEHFLLSQFKDSKDGLPATHKVAIFKAEGYGINFNDSGIAEPTKNGEVVKNENREAKKFSDVADEFSVLYKWDNAVGRGGENENGKNGKFKDFNELFAHMEKENIDPDSTEGTGLQEELKKTLNKK